MKRVLESTLAVAVIGWSLQCAAIGAPKADNGQNLMNPPWADTGANAPQVAAPKPAKVKPAEPPVPRKSGDAWSTSENVSAPNVGPTSRSYGPGKPTSRANNGNISGPNVGPTSRSYGPGAAAVAAHAAASAPAAATVPAPKAASPAATPPAPTPPKSPSSVLTVAKSSPPAPAVHHKAAHAAPVTATKSTAPATPAAKKKTGDPFTDAAIGE